MNNDNYQLQMLFARFLNLQVNSISQHPPSRAPSRRSLRPNLPESPEMPRMRPPRRNPTAWENARASVGRDHHRRPIAYGRSSQSSRSRRAESHPRPRSDITTKLDPYLNQNYWLSNQSIDLDHRLLDNLVKRLAELPLNPSKWERQMIVANRVSRALDVLKTSPRATSLFVIQSIFQLDSNCLDSIHPDEELIEFVAVLSTKPTTRTIYDLTNHLMEQLFGEDDGRYRELQFSLDNIQLPRFEGIIVRVYISTLHDIIPQVAQSFGKFLYKNWYSILRTVWYQSEIVNRNNTTAISLVRLMLDIRSRFVELGALTPWMMTVLCEYCSHHPSSTKRRPVFYPLEFAFKRLLGMITRGLFIRCHGGIKDPVDRKSSVHCDLSFYSARKITSVVRILCEILRTRADGVHYVLGLDIPEELKNQREAQPDCEDQQAAGGTGSGSGNGTSSKGAVQGKPERPSAINYFFHL